MTAIGDPQVLAAHPLLIVGLADSLQPWRADVVGETLRCSPSCVEDLDALPVEEQAAIACSSQASGPLMWDQVPLAQVPIGIAQRAYASIPNRVYERLDYPLTWAEGESLIRTGKVRP